MFLGLYGFLTVVLLTTSFFILLAGVFMAYFGRGKSRKKGIYLGIGGVVLGFITYLTYYFDLWGGQSFIEILIPSIYYIGAFIIGLIIAIGIFLLIIIKS
ncbi:hypothetical protein [Methanonatronarchaeum sp. AMET-Sl]|uniref:hypothetical protein n=1 Tax=Methanonatronarchaeum sp. AMET-Sl TaxID=3037654 RepID=UPI00244DBCA2|nr:hypothetical protein [Methanonatronarchaeum sp. AMET-Sl]WGI17647.1 hypothetical protein QEN48_01160 [Methanonatronarchaeum sp. AMET-Sl]